MNAPTLTALALVLAASTGSAQEAAGQDVPELTSPFSDMDATADDPPGTGYSSPEDRIIWNDSMTVDDLDAAEAAARGAAPSLPDQIAASDLEGAAIYSVSAEAFAAMTATPEEGVDIAPDWAQIGTVDDLVIDASGDIQGVIGAFGGVLGFGAQEVTLPADQVAVRLSDDATPIAVTTLSQAELEAMTTPE
ncbi:MAG: PRC-barrel domain-containing protein [Pseudomonadota bacterium]